MLPIFWQWNEQAVAWFESASAYTGFHQNLAQRILPFIKRRDSLVDLGCGAGFIDFCLSPHIGHITCVDQNETALFHLNRLAGQKKLQNIETRLADARSLSGRWNTVLSVFFGRLDTSARDFLNLCDESFIAVVHAHRQGKLGLSEYRPPKCNTVSMMKQALDAMDIHYTCVVDELEYGQPFQTADEAEQFVRAYSQNPPDTVVSEYLSQTLQKTQDERYPYYLPNLKTFGIFVIRRDQNAHICQR